ncbi:MAG: hypothetical protein KC492_11570 [Myxococcales bacterium]|nr:hypothetical protein [Myxococcales bacterium]
MPDDIWGMIGAVFGSLAAGGLCGLVPRAMARARGKVTSGSFAFWACTVAGLMLGAQLAIPLALALAAVYRALDPVSPERRDPYYGDP